jgi:flagellar biogenesis protein FliO
MKNKISHAHKTAQSERLFTDALDKLMGVLAFILFLFYPAVFMYL